MDMRSRFTLTSSWQASAKLTSLLRVVNSSGVVMDEPYSSERAQTITLVRPAAVEDGPQPPACYLGIDSSHLRGYSLAAVEVISGSRTAEIYSPPGEDYITTVRGSLEKQEDGTKIYSIQFELPEDYTSHSLSLKLLSLQDRSKVMVKEINVIVCEDYGGTKQTISSEETDRQGRVDPLRSSVDLQQMLQTIGATQSVPPFLKSLASSLKILQLQQSTATPTAPPLPSMEKRTTSTAGDSVPSMPAQLCQMMEALKQMRPPSPTTTASEQSTNVERDREERVDGQEAAAGEERTKVDASEQVHRLLDERMSELEKRLLGYVDSKVAELEKKILLKLETLAQRIETRQSQYQLNSSRDHSSVSNGVLPPAPLPEDTQLD